MTSSQPIQPQPFQKLQPFLKQLKQDFWEFGNLAWGFAFIDRLVTAFSTGLPSATNLIQVFTTLVLAACWLLLNPMPNSTEALYNRFQPIFSAPTAPPATPMSIEQLQRFGYQQTVAWRGWNVRHTVIPNSRSQVPVIFVHGFGGSIGHWRQNMSALSKHHSVYAIDLLGFGASDKPDINYSIELWTEQLHEFWQTYIGKPVVLVGNSIGSLVCSATAATHPEMVCGVAMISLPDTGSHQATVPVMVRPVIRAVQTVLLSPLLLYPLFHILRQPRIVRRWAGLAYTCQEAVTDELLEILTKPATERDSARAFGAILRAMASPTFSPSVQSILGKIQMPSLLLWGKQDRMIPLASAQQFLSYNPNLQLVELDNAGHCAHDERPEQVNSELLQWIQTRVLSQMPVRMI